MENKRKNGCLVIKQTSTLGRVGTSKPPQVILGFAGARRALCPYTIFISQQIRTSSTGRHLQPLQKYACNMVFYSHFRDEKLTYSKARTCRLTGENGTWL